MYLCAHVGVRGSILVRTIAATEKMADEDALAISAGHGRPTAVVGVVEYEHTSSTDAGAQGA